MIPCFRISATVTPCITFFLTGSIFLTLITGVAWAAPSTNDGVYRLKLDPKPFRAGLCKEWKNGTTIKIQAAKHRDLVIHTLPGQWIPQDPLQARTKNYTHFISLEDLSNGRLSYGAIAFREDRAAIFTANFPKGISRPQYLSSLGPNLQAQGNSVLDRFLRLLPILNAAIDSCRPYPPSITYDTDDEIDRIEKGRLDFYHLIRAYNERPLPKGLRYQHESGTSGGFFDPDAGKGNSKVSYHALNPLDFYTSEDSPR